MLKIFCFAAVGLILLQPSCDSASGTAEHPQSAIADSAGFAVVELFTSEGCSSCPPADKLAITILAEAEKKHQTVLVLSEHVDYWDRIGWKDPFSKHFFTDRQGWYARLLKDETVYTPQMVVNGLNGFVGSDKAKATTAIQAALKSTYGNESIALTCSGAKLDSFFYTIPAQSRGNVLHVALVQKKAVSDVLRGENQGKTLSHANVVLDWITLDKPGFSGVIKFNDPASADQVIAFLQDKETGTITNVGSVSRKPGDRL